VRDKHNSGKAQKTVKPGGRSYESEKIEKEE
jgi:hypothetical protein